MPVAHRVELDCRGRAAADGGTRAPAGREAPAGRRAARAPARSRARAPAHGRRPRGRPADRPPRVCIPTTSDGRATTHRDGSRTRPRFRRPGGLRCEGSPRRTAPHARDSSPTRPRREQPGDVRDPAHVLRARGRVEAEVAAEAVAHVVAVEDVGDAAAVHEGALQAVRDGRLAGRREAREPHRRAVLPGRLPPGRAVELAGLPGDVGAVGVVGEVGAQVARGLAAWRAVGTLESLRVSWKDPVNGALRRTGYQLRKAGHRRRRVRLQPGDRLLEPPVFVMCTLRSGSTLLRVLLDSHSQIHCPHELHLRDHLGVDPRRVGRALDEGDGARRGAARVPAVGPRAAPRAGRQRQAACWSTRRPTTSSSSTGSRTLAGRELRLPAAPPRRDRALAPGTRRGRRTRREERRPDPPLLRGAGGGAPDLRRRDGPLRGPDRRPGAALAPMCELPRRRRSSRRCSSTASSTTAASSPASATGTRRSRPAGSSRPRRRRPPRRSRRRCGPVAATWGYLPPEGDDAPEGPGARAARNAPTVL